MNLRRFERTTGAVPGELSDLDYYLTASFPFELLIFSSSPSDRFNPSCSDYTSLLPDIGPLKMYVNLSRVQPSSDTVQGLLVSNCCRNVKAELYMATYI